MNTYKSKQSLFWFGFVIALIALILTYFVAPVLGDTGMPTSTAGDPVTDAAIAAIITILIIILLLQLARAQGETPEHVDMLAIGLRPLVNALLRKIPDTPQTPAPPKAKTPCQKCMGKGYPVQGFMPCNVCGGTGAWGNPAQICQKCLPTVDPPGRGWITCDHCGVTGIEPET